MKKYLIVKVAHDVSNFNDEQIALYKSLMLAGCDLGTQERTSFELIITPDEAVQNTRMLNYVRQEFRKQDSQHEKTH